MTPQENVLENDLPKIELGRLFNLGVHNKPNKRVKEDIAVAVAQSTHEALSQVQRVQLIADIQGRKGNDNDEDAPNQRYSAYCSHQAKGDYETPCVLVIYHSSETGWYLRVLNRELHKEPTNRKNSVK